MFGWNTTFAQSGQHYAKKDFTPIKMSLKESVAEFNCAAETWNTRCGESNGKLVAYAEGGVPPYTYKFTDNQTNQVILKKTTYDGSVEKPGLSFGTYRVDIEDNDNNHYALYKAQIDASSAPVATLLATKENCGKKDATVNVTVNGGKTQGMFFDWVGPNGFKSKSQNISGLSAGTYTVTVTDGDWCTDVKSVQIMNSGGTVFGYISMPTCDSSLLGHPKTAPEVYKSQFGCDSMNVVTYYSGFAFKTITRVVCTPIVDVYLRIPRNLPLCDSVVHIIHTLAPAPKLQTRSEFSCFAKPATHDTLYSAQGCDSVYIMTNFVVKKPDTTRLSVYVCGLKKPSHKEFKLQNQFGCDSLVIIDSLVPGKVTTLPIIFRYTCDSTQVVPEARDTQFYTYGCDSLITVTRVRYIAPIRKVNLSYECDKSKSGVFPHYYQNQYGCDSTVVDSVVYAGSKITILPTKEFCGTKNSDTVVDSLFTNFRGCDSMVQQRIIEKESPMIIENGYTHPTVKWNGTANFTVSGGTMPYKWLWSTGSTKTSLSGAKGGKYVVTVSDANGCKDTANVNLSDFWASSTKPGIVTIHGGLADQMLIDLYGAENGYFSIRDLMDHELFSETIDMREEYSKDIPVQAKGMLIALIKLPNGYLLSKVEVH